MVPTAVFAYNISFHLVTKFSPFRLLYGREPAMPALTYPILLNEPIDGTEHYVMKLTRELIKLQTEAYENLSHHVVSRTEHNNACRPALLTFEINDQVYFYANQGAGRKDKLSMMWWGPATIVCKGFLDNYTIKDNCGLLIGKVHASHLKPFKISK